MLQLAGDILPAGQIAFHLVRMQHIPDGAGLGAQGDAAQRNIGAVGGITSASSQLL